MESAQSPIWSSKSQTLPRYNESELDDEYHESSVSDVFQLYVMS